MWIHDIAHNALLFELSDKLIEGIKGSTMSDFEAIVLFIRKDNGYDGISVTHSSIHLAKWLIILKGTNTESIDLFLPKIIYKTMLFNVMLLNFPIFASRLLCIFI